MKKTFLMLATLIIFASANAQDTKQIASNLTSYAKTDTTQGWKHFGISSLTFGQTALQNWVAGGDNTVSGNFIFNFSMNYVKDKVFWDNNLFAEYGLINSAANGTIKSTDKLGLTSVAGRMITDKWSVSGLMKFYTQFAKGYNYPNKDTYISTFMAPGYLDAAVGFSYKPNKNYSIFMSPVSERIVFVLDDSLSNAGALGVKPGKKSRFDTGAYLLANTNQTLAENLNLISTLDMFTPYSKDFGNIDINWNVLLSYKFSKYFSATLNTTLRYYDKEISRVQFKEIFGFGITYQF